MLKNKKKLYQKLFGCFFLLMFLLTVLTRILDSVILPKVWISSYTKGNLNYRLEGEGTVKASEAVYVDIPKGIKVDRVLSCGDHVEEGEGIIYLNLSDLEDKSREIQRELQKMQLSLEQERLSAKAEARITRQEQLAGSLALEEKKVQDAIAEMQQAQEEYDKGIRELKKKREQEKDFAKQQKSYSREETEYGNRGLDKEDQRSGAQAELDYDRRLAGIEEDYESALEQLEENRQGAVLKVNDRQDACNQLLYDMNLALKEDENTLKNEQVAAQVSGKRQGIQEIDMEAKQEEFQELEELLLAEGQVKSPAKGVLTKMDVIPGSVIGGEEIVEIGKGKLLFYGSLNKEAAGILEEGDILDISMPMLNQKVKAAISGISIDGSTQEPKTTADSFAQDRYAVFTAVLEEDNYRIGSTASFTASKDSKLPYHCLIPLSAVREDENGKYCLIAENSTTILGEEDIAVRVNLELLGSDDQNAAVNGGFTDADRIIAGSSKSIREGDRVRVQ